MIRVSLREWPDAPRELHKLTSDELEELIESARSEQSRRESFTERCISFRNGYCLELSNPCIPNRECWVKK